MKLGDHILLHKDLTGMSSRLKSWHYILELMRTRNTVINLEILVDKQDYEPMQLYYQFGEYYWHFVTILDWLLS